MKASKAARLLRTALTAGTFMLVGPACSEPTDDAPRHVVLISLDTTRADHLGCYGSATVRTPRLDGFAKGSVLFRNVQAPAPTTLASHTSLMTGVYPHTHGVLRNGYVVDASNRMLAEELSKAGFHTAGFLGSFALHSNFAFDQGFEHFDAEFDMRRSPNGNDQNQRRAEDVTEAVLTHVDTVDAERLFLFVHYFDPHAPYDPPEPYDRMYTANGAPDSADYADVRQAVRRHQKRLMGDRAPGMKDVIVNGLPAELLEKADGETMEGDERLAALYAGEVSYLDEHIGRLLDGLAERGILENAIVIITGDHGEAFWEHGDHWNHGLWVYETTLRVPLIFHVPGNQGPLGAGTVVDEPVSTIDVVPTLLDLLHLKSPKHLEGQSLVPALEGRPARRGAIFSQATQPIGMGDIEGQWGNLHKPRCIRDGRWKFVHAPHNDYEELYDLEADPDERTNLLLQPNPPAELLAVRDRLMEELTEWARTARKSPSHLNPAQFEESMKRLEALGYHGDGE